MSPATARATCASRARSTTEPTCWHCARRAPRRARRPRSAAPSTRDSSSGELVVFDDLHFLANRLPDGSICSSMTHPGLPAVVTGSTRAPSRSRCAARCWAAPPRPASGRGTAAATGTSTGRASTPARRFACWPHAGSAPSARPRVPRRSSAARPRCPTRSSAIVTDYANGVKERGDPGRAADRADGPEHRSSVAASRAPSR